ncbi:MAG TPA: hypothetical protein VHW09_26640 [Bryobacteraceae bacterium]|nr:hypothetical protein [Bryobacteraceae bacterium]
MGNEPRPKSPRDLFIIDEAVRSEYFYIEPADSCYYIWERMSRLWREGGRTDYSHYPVNGLISNLQILTSVRKSQSNRAYWKDKAIHYAAQALGSLLRDSWRDASITYVPIPPSKMLSDPEYDPRLLETLGAVRPALHDIRQLVILDDEEYDSKKKGLRPADRAYHYSVNEDLAYPEPETVVLFDDVLTTGCHFKAMELVLKRRFPAADVVGLFLARTVRPPEDSEDLFASLLAE